MYVCICHAVTDTDISDAMASGATSVDDLGDTLGLGTGCGSCVELAATVLNTGREAGKGYRTLPGASVGVYRYAPAV